MLFKTFTLTPEVNVRAQSGECRDGTPMQFLDVLKILVNGANTSVYRYHAVDTRRYLIYIFVRRVFVTKYSSESRLDLLSFMYWIECNGVNTRPGISVNQVSVMSRYTWLCKLEKVPFARSASLFSRKLTLKEPKRIRPPQQFLLYLNRLLFFRTETS